MAVLLKIVMLTDENDSFIREYQIPYSSTLQDLHELIIRDLQYEPDVICSFFQSDRDWERGKEYTLMDIGAENGPELMSSIGLGDVLRRNGDRLIYVFDMLGDRAFYMELIGTRETSDNAVESVVRSEAEPPGQFAGEETETYGSIFDEALGEFGEFEGDELYDDE